MTLPELENRLQQPEGDKDIRILHVGKSAYKAVLWREDPAKGFSDPVATGVGRSIAGALENLELKLKEIK